MLNGPNLNMLGVRQPEVYGRETLSDVVALVGETAARHGVQIVDFQSNSEEALINRLHESLGNIAGIIINPAGFTHTSVALRDALVIPDVPIVEVHISNVHAREEFRRHSYVSPIATAVVAGMGTFGYVAALEFLVRLLGSQDEVAP
nr:type II 3-dehydroquinate dehydratase [Antrihabitans stalactiti]